MRRVTKVLLASGAAAVAALAPAVAAAQNDVTPRLPNVLLLLDTSGSMEYLIPPDPSDPTGVRLMTPEASTAPSGAACSVSGGTTTVLNRWATLATVLTGTIPTGAGGFGCEKVDRSSAAFVSEYTYANGGNPYDYNYFLPFHRIYSNGCTVGAIPVTNNSQDWSSWPNNAFDFHKSTGTCASNAANCCTWSGQLNDGLLDNFSQLVRFGLMTFDSFPDPSTGAVPGVTPRIDAAGAMTGMWSYFHGWQNFTTGTPTIGNKPAAGNPNACQTPRFMEVGARNPAAPPWEGPLTGFGDPASDTNLAQNNTAIQWEILAMRPYGATPIAGMLDDAKEFLFTDDTKVPGTARDFGPRQDPYWVNGCRKTYVILLTDGEPNMDLRGPTGLCDATPADGTWPGQCPYKLPDQTITDLRLSPPTPNQSVLTFVVGFAVSNPASLPPGKTSCSQLDIVNDCTNPPAGLAACCTLQKLAVAGGTNQAYFADNPSQLKQAIATVLSQIVRDQTARTPPVFSPAGPANAQGATMSSANTAASTYQFIAKFNVTSTPAVAGAASGVWTGFLQRERWTCPSGVPTLQPISKTAGDDYASNLDTTDISHPRQFFTVIAEPNSLQSGDTSSDNTIRPFIPADDGFGTYKVSSSSPTSLMSATTFPSTMQTFPLALGISNATTACTTNFSVTNQPGTCANNLITWEIGGNNISGPTPIVSRDPQSAYCQPSTGRTCSKLGAIYHSTPIVVGPPKDFLNDDTYSAYANDPLVVNKPMVMYTATIDGQLHAFKVAASVSTDTFTTDTQSNNELWSFFPPGVLKGLMSSYNVGGANLLDGAPVVADVPGAVVSAGAAPVFTRTPTSAVKWHRVLVASSGAGGGAKSFYYALDVTDPTVAPQFLWQLSTDVNGNAIFGGNTPTPAIASIALNISNVRTQVPVAILAGGSGTLAASCPTPPTPPTHARVVLNDPNNPSNPGGTPYRLNNFAAPALRCWGQDPANANNKISGNSITIVRLDTGQVLAHFTGKGSLSAGGNSTNLFANQPFSAPMTGQPVAFPSDTGQIADRIYVGDADGQLWRINVADPNIANWTVDLAWDAYLDSSSAAREVIQLPPIVSRDPIGNPVVLFATGDQNLITTQSTDNRVWSLTEVPVAPATFQMSQNWRLGWPQAANADRHRVTGPMTLFNSALYFATYVPQLNSTNVCATGGATLWAADYRRPDPASVPSGQPLGAFPNGVVPPPLNMQGTTDGSVIYGVSVSVTPSCSGSQTSQDPYFGSHTQVSNVASSEFRVMWQTGMGAGISNSSVIKNDTSIAHVQFMTVPPPGQATKVDSWAAVVE